MKSKLKKRKSKTISEERQRELDEMYSQNKFEGEFSEEELYYFSKLDKYSDVY